MKNTVRFATVLLVVGASTAIVARGTTERDEDARKDPAPRKVEARFGLAISADGPFPSDRFTVADETQNTCERISLPADCSVRSDTQPNDCVEVELLNQLDGFNIRPRIAVPFSGQIDLATVNSETVFLVSLGDTLVQGAPSCRVASRGDDEDEDARPPADAGWIVGIDQGIWDPDTNTLYVEAAEPLVPHTRYALIVTRGVKDMSGDSVAASKEFKRAIGDDEDDERTLEPALTAYRAALRKALSQVRFSGVRRHDVVVASVFTSMSVTSVMEKIHAQLAAAPPAAADFTIGPADARALFNLADITALTFNRQVKTVGALSPIDITVRLATLKLVPGAVAQVAAGKFASPRYLLNRVMPPVGTFSGTPVVQANEDVFFTLFIPSGTKPAGGWPVVIWGQGSNDTVYGGPLNAASEMASKGFATIAIHFVGNGFGPASTLTVTRPAAKGGAMTFLTGGRGVDVNGDGNIDPGEGAQQGPPVGILLGSNAIKQSTIDVLQLVQVIRAGVDVDGNGTIDLDASRQYFAGLSLGGLIGVLAFTVEPQLRAGAFSGVGGWPNLWNVPTSRGEFGSYLQRHLPSLLPAANGPGLTSIGGVAVLQPYFNENQPVAGQAPIVNTVPGAIQILGAWERFEWLSNPSMPGAYAPHLRMKPLSVPARPFLIHVARGDQSVTNPSEAWFIEAGLLADRTTLYRNDLFSGNASFKNPHAFLNRTDSASAPLQTLAIQAQTQIATFFQTDGATVIDPDGDGVLFETPASFIPRDTGFIP
jgi:hypothetical protein